MVGAVKYGSLANQNASVPKHHIVAFRAFNPGEFMKNSTHSSDHSSKWVIEINETGRDTYTGSKTCLLVAADMLIRTAWERK